MQEGMVRRHGMAAVAALLAGAVASALAPVAAAAAEPDMLFTFFQVEQFEHRFRDGQDSFNWDAQGWIGGDDHKLWLKTEGEQPSRGKLEQAEIQVLYSRRVSDFFDVQSGLRYDLRPAPERAFFVLGVQGLAPYFLELDAALFVSQEGEVSARFEVEYDLLLTQRLVLQPSLEVNLAAQPVHERGIGSGVNDVELGLRLRYEITRELAPYLGVNWERKLGRTGSLARAEGEDADALTFVVGVRFWF